MEDIISKVQKIVGNNAGHGMDHIISVLRNTKKMVECNKLLSDVQITIIYLAALLHDVDDHKFFEDTSNAETILKNSPFFDLSVEVLFCVACVSYSSNQNKFPKSVPSEFDRYGFNRTHFNETSEFAETDLWILYPRFADRLEAIDLGRALEFGRSRQRPDFNENTPPIRSLEEFKQIDFDELEKEYIQRRCKSHPSRNTSMDHVYEKCMNLVKMKSKNEWCETEKLMRHIKLMNDIVKFWQLVFQASK